MKILIDDFERKVLFVPGGDDRSFIVVHPVRK